MFRSCLVWSVGRRRWTIPLHHGRFGGDSEEISTPVYWFSTGAGSRWEIRHRRTAPGARRLGAARHDDHLYSAKAPGVALLAVGPYFALDRSGVLGELVRRFGDRMAKENTSRTKTTRKPVAKRELIDTGSNKRFVVAVRAGDLRNQMTSVVR